MHELVIQIVNYNTKKYLVRCLDLVFNDLHGSSIDYKILVLDNHSADDLGDLQEKYQLSDKIEFYKNNKNVGFGGGHNILANKLESKYLLILNPDIIFIEKNTIERMFNFIRQDNKINVLGPQLINGNNRIQAWDHGELQSILSNVLESIGLYFWRPQNKIVPVAWVSGAVFLIQKNIFIKLNGFDDNIFMYGEELELCMRIRKNAGMIVYNPKIKILHIGQVSSRRHKHMFVSYQYILNKHHKGSILYYPAKIVSLVCSLLFSKK